MKQGINILLPVKFKNISFTDVSKVEFIFKQDKLTCADVIKLSVYKSDGTGDAQLRDGTSIIDIPWNSEETYLFRPNDTFYMDTKIYMNTTDKNPITPIIALRMDLTLFEQEDEEEESES